MKKYLLSIFAFALLLLPLSPVAAKLDLGKKGLDKAAVETAGYTADANGTGLAELVGTIIKTLLSFVGVIFLVLMVYAGYLWMTAQGEESQIEKAQGIIRSSVIGMVILVGAYSITAFVVPKIVEKTAGGGGGGGGNNLGGNEYCCAVCDNNGENCFKTVTQNEQECNANPQCISEEKYCSVQIVPAGQCTGGTDNVNCCVISKPRDQSAKQVVNGMDPSGECDRICEAENDRNNASWGDVDKYWSCSMETVKVGQCQ